MAKPIEIPLLDAEEFDRLVNSKQTPLQAEMLKRGIDTYKKTKRKR
jgi:hypothetical protein